MIRLRLLIFAVALLACPCGVALAGVQSSWNSGYNGWWPAGYGYPPMTVHAHGYECSATAYGPTFHSPSGKWSQDYGGGTSCTAGVGTKSFTVSDQVLGQDGRTWYTISGSTFTGGPITGNPLRMRMRRAAYLGHEYRTVVTAKLVVPNGYAGCSFTNSCYQTIVISAASRPLAP
jgi:hypothetical protein